MGKRTVAEFVGDAETLELIRDMGIDYGQGFHIGKPIENIEDLDDRRRVIPLRKTGSSG